MYKNQLTHTILKNTFKCLVEKLFNTCLNDIATKLSTHTFEHRTFCVQHDEYPHR